MRSLCPPALHHCRFPGFRWTKAHGHLNGDLSMQDYNALPLDQLRTLHRELGALIAQRRHEALEQVKQQIAVLGFNIDDLVPKRRKEVAPKPHKYRDPDAPEQTWSGRGK